MLDVGQAPAAIRAAVLALKAADRDLRNQIARATREVMSPVWQRTIAEHSTWRMDDLVLGKGARIKAGNPPAAIAATSRRKLSGGLQPSTQWQAIEFGLPANHKRTYNRRSKNGGTHKVTRHTGRQLPTKTPKGRVVYPAVKAIAPRMASLWVQLIVRTYHEAAEEATR